MATAQTCEGCRLPAEFLSLCTKCHRNCCPKCLVTFIGEDEKTLCLDCESSRGILGSVANSFIQIDTKPTASDDVTGLLDSWADLEDDEEGADVSGREERQRERERERDAVRDLSLYASMAHPTEYDRNRWYERTFGHSHSSLPSITSSFDKFRHEILQCMYSQKHSPPSPSPSLSPSSSSSSSFSSTVPKALSLSSYFSQEHKEQCVFYFVPGIYTGKVPGSADSPDVFKLWFQQVRKYALVLSRKRARGKRNEEGKRERERQREREKGRRREIYILERHFILM
jgi:hypothetical protein